MKTKSFFAIMILTFLALNYVSAQDQMTFGVRAGVNFQNINGKDSGGDKLENDLLTGFHAGVNVEIPVGTDVYFQPGLLFSTKGGKLNEGDASAKLHTSYVEMPLNLLFKPLLGTGHMLLGFGPYVAYGIGGKLDTEIAGVSEEIDVKYQSEVTDSDPDDVFYMKGFDAGANFIIGYEMASMLSLQLNAQLGLLDLTPKYPVDDDSTMKNTGFGLSIGYRF